MVLLLCTLHKTKVMRGKSYCMSDADKNESTATEKIWNCRSRQTSKAHKFQRRYFQRTLAMSIYTTLEEVPKQFLSKNTASAASAAAAAAAAIP